MSLTSLIIVPTYNEIDNLDRIVTDIKSHSPESDILIVDDNSPDGTGRAAEADSRVSVLHRATKDGLGRAYLSGFEWGIERHYDVLVEMDADGSHPASELQAMINLAHTHDVVVGSRYVRGGRTQGWSKRREALSRTANHAISLLLHLGVADATSGYRVYRADFLKQLDFGHVESAGYGFQVDMTRQCVQASARIIEHPITFREREYGTSKMSGSIIREAAFNLVRWSAQDTRARWSQERTL